jgi:hypothetical protein
MAGLISKLYETGLWPRVTVIVLKKKPRAAKFSDYRTFSFVANTARK